MSGDLVLFAGDAGRYDLLLRQADDVITSGLAPASLRTPGAVLVCLQMGQELGLAPMQALRSIHVIDGRQALSADLQAALVRRHGGKIRIPESSTETCTVEVERDGEVYTVTWTLADADRAGLLVSDKGKEKKNWARYPRQMLRARALAEACRLAYQDVLAGIFAEEELVEERSERGETPEPGRRLTPEEVTARLGGEEVKDAEVVGSGGRPSGRNGEQRMPGEAPVTVAGGAAPEPTPKPSGLPWRIAKFPNGTDRRDGDGFALVSHEPKADPAGRLVHWGRRNGKPVPLRYQPDGRFAVATPADPQPAEEGVLALAERLHLVVEVMSWDRDGVSVADAYERLCAAAFEEATQEERAAVAKEVAALLGVEAGPSGVPAISAWFLDVLGTPTLQGATRDLLADARAAIAEARVAVEAKAKQEHVEREFVTNPDAIEMPF